VTSYKLVGNLPLSAGHQPVSALRPAAYFRNRGNDSVDFAGPQQQKIVQNRGCFLHTDPKAANLCAFDPLPLDRQGR